ncbi:DegT/DnrJ/EryC1/StrS family aminotransferase [Salininema proteolyticum]|uniref:DegT/DnrJ/EryC1/StrS family aminotransferase n=1 Tax=Salininema proteolyticum TaxID=1607685 RepID=A0ABV8U467_9ACTN
MSSNPSEFIPPAAPRIGDAEIEAAVAVLRTGRVVQGPEVAAFESEFSETSGTEHCVAVNSGTSALQLSLMALGFGPGDEIIVPSFSFAATANVVRLVGAEPVFADIDPRTFNIDPESAASLISPKTAAIIPVHLYGHPADMTALTALADKHGLAVVEDACQAHASSIDGTPVGSFGSVGTFSFYPTKNMHALEGGIVSTDDAQLARTLRLLRNQGMEQRYANEVVGANMRMTDVSAAIGRVQLASLKEWTLQRQANAEFLNENISSVVTPHVAPGVSHVYHQYTVRVEGDRERFQEVLKDEGVGSAVYYPTPIHRLKPFWDVDQERGRTWDLPETEKAAGEVLSLPVHPSLSRSDLERIAQAVEKAGSRQ